MSARNHAAKPPQRNARGDCFEPREHTGLRWPQELANFPARQPDTKLYMPNTERPFLILTAICDASARPAAITLGHGDAMERALRSAEGQATDGLDLVELPIAPAAFAALRKYLQFEDGRVTVYDLFPLSASLDARYRAIAGQFLAAEALWALEEQGMLSGVPFTVQFDVPRGWDKDPKKLHERLVSEKALDLSDAAVETFKRVKGAWDRSAL